MKFKSITNAIALFIGAWHYEKYSASCPTGNDYAIAQQLAREEKLGVWNGSHQAPWEWRRANK